MELYLLFFIKLLKFFFPSSFLPSPPSPLFFSFCSAEDGIQGIVQGRLYPQPLMSKNSLYNVDISHLSDIYAGIFFSL